MLMRHRQFLAAIPLVAALVVAGSGTARSDSDPGDEPRVTHHDRVTDRNAQRTLEEGRRIFRFDTFGDEAFWGDTVKLHHARFATDSYAVAGVDFKCNAVPLP